MINNAINILVIEDNPGDFFLVKSYLDLTGLLVKNTYNSTSIKEALIFLDKENIDIILLDLSLPDSRGISSFKAVYAKAQRIPIVVLSGGSDVSVSLETVSLGAQDYLIKEDLNEKILAKTIQYSIERKRNLEKLRESNERYELVSKAASDMVWDWDLVNGNVYRNKEGWEKIFGNITGDEFMKPNAFIEHLHPDDAPATLEYVENFLHSATLNKFEIEFRVKRNDGTDAYILDKGYLIRNDKGEPIRMIGTSQDITEKKLAEIKVQFSEQRFRSLVQRGSDMIKVLDANANFTYISPTVKNVLGFEPDDMVGKNAFDFIHPNDLPYTKEQFNIIKNKEYIELMPFRFKDANNKWRWIETKLTNLIDDISINGIVANSRDITEKKRAQEIIKASEERYRNLFFNNPMAILIWDIDTLKIVEINDTACKEYNYTRQELLQMTLLDIKPAEEHENVKQFAIMFKKNQEQMVSGIWRHISKQGTVLFMEEFCHKMEYEGKHAVLAIANNVSEKIKLAKRLEEEKAMKQKQITEAVMLAQEKERYEISQELHDNVNQILTAARIYAESAKTDTANRLNLLNQSSGYIVNAIEEIRKLSRALVTPLANDRSLPEAIKSLVADMSVAGKLHFEIQSPSFSDDDMPDNFKLNIFRIVQEQLNNIIKHAEASVVKINLERRGAVLKLIITDNGIGFDATQKRNGIGISNIIRRVELYNGVLDIQSAPGNGCTLLIKFPMQDDFLPA